MSITAIRAVRAYRTDDGKTFATRTEAEFHAAKMELHEALTNVFEVYDEIVDPDISDLLCSVQAVTVLAPLFANVARLVFKLKTPHTEEAA